MCVYYVVRQGFLNTRNVLHERALNPTRKVQQKYFNVPMPAACIMKKKERVTLTNAFLMTPLSLASSPTAPAQCENKR